MIHLKQSNFLRFLFLTSAIALLSAGYATAQQSVRIHSHNDYRQCVPFYQAYAQQVYSIEADIYAVDRPGGLFVAHDPEELSEALTLDELYIQPIVSLYKRNGGRAWKSSDLLLQLMIDLKTPEEPTLDRLVALLSHYPEVFDPVVNPYAVRILITGNCPQPAHFDNYPAFISFDGKTDISYTEKQLKRVGIFSDSFRKYSTWNGKGGIVTSEKKKLEEIINKVHAWGKQIRFWGTPDGITAWNTFYTMGVDIINTDRVEACTDFFRNFDNKNFVIISDTSSVSEEVARASRLDKTTSGFGGFGKHSRMLTRASDVYRPTYLNDGIDKPVKNVILLIGDGMGLTAIGASEAVNKGLSLLQCKHIGLQQTNAKDQYTTDSAGAGSSIATGESNSNRHISMSEEGKIYPSLPEMLVPQGFAAGVVTLGNIADATPAAFYGHATERDNSDEITGWLRNGNLTLLCGSGMQTLTHRKDKLDLVAELKPHYAILSSSDSINAVCGKVICVDERTGEATTQENLPLLADVTREAIRKLHLIADKGFFLMVEGAKIDYAGHANSLPGTVMETLSFDQAVAEALKFADNNGETLVIVTADHETGGLTLIDGNIDSGAITACYVTDDHTPVMIPVFAYGPRSSRFCGVYRNTEIFHRIIESIQ